jgi:hypothetical protein
MVSNILFTGLSFLSFYFLLVYVYFGPITWGVLCVYRKYPLPASLGGEGGVNRLTDVKGEGNMKRGRQRKNEEKT